MQIKVLWMTFYSLSAEVRLRRRLLYEICGHLMQQLLTLSTVHAVELDHRSEECNSISTPVFCL